MSGRLADKSDFQHCHLVYCTGCVALSVYVYPCSLRLEVINVWEREKFFGCIFLVSCYCRYCRSYCEASVSVFRRHGWARIRTLYGFNTVVVCLLQVVVLMNEAFPFDSMLCDRIHYFPHWKWTFLPLILYEVSHVAYFTKWLNRSCFFHHSYGCIYHGSSDKS